MKIRKQVKIKNQYNQIPHLTQDIIWESDTNTIKHHIHDSQEFSPFLAGDHKAAWNRKNSVTDKHETQKSKKRSTKEEPHGKVSKKITGGLEDVWRYQPHPYLNRLFYFD